ncbi:MAG TPA: hypothetical protein VH878_05255 [Thermodesulfobacteriota bacterium]|jgi:hypothetical protein
MAQHGVDGGIYFSGEEMKNLAACVIGDEELLLETKKVLQEIYDQMQDEKESEKDE